MKRYIDHKGMRESNLRDVFSLIKKGEPITRKEIEAITGMSWGGVSGIMTSLTMGKYVVERKPEKSTGAGRTPFQIYVNGDDNFILGVEINHMGLKASMINMRGDELDRGEKPLTEITREHVLNAVFELIEEMLNRNINKNIIGIGVAMQGGIDRNTGVSLFFPNCGDWENVEIRKILSDKFNLPVYLEHDPNCVLIAESEKQDIIENTIFIRLDKGVGMAVYEDGRIFHGALEIAHMIVEPDGAACSCGGRGCLEMYASQSGLERMTGMPFNKLVLKNDDETRKIFRKMAEYLGIALSNASRLFRPKYIVLSGEMTTAADLFLDDLISVMQKYTFNKYSPEIVLSKIDSYGASYGAALIALELLLAEIKI